MSLPTLEDIEKVIREAVEDQMPRPKVRTSGLCKYLGGVVSPRTAEKWRLTGEGPPFIRVSRNLILYDLDDVDKWLASRRRISTADSGEGTD